MTAPMNFKHVKVGDIVTRLLAEAVPMVMKVTDVDDDLIHCGSWTFDRVSGAEVDHGLGWGPQYGVTGSRLVEEDA